MSIVPGPSIPESIVTRARLWPDAVTSDFQNDAVNSRYGDRQLFSTHNPPISQHPPISHNPGDRNYVCQSQPLSDLRPGSSNPGYFMEPLNDMPPPKRKLPFAEHSAQKKAKVTTNSDKPVSKKKNTAKSNVTSSKKEAVEIPKQDEPKTYDLRVRESENLPERLPIGSNPKKSLNSAVASSGQLPSVPRHPGKVLAASPNQPAKTAAKTTVPTQKSEDIQEGSSKVRSQTKKPAKKPSQTKLKTDLPIKKSSKGEPSKKEASKKGPHKRTVPQNKTSTKQAPRARIFACASTATQTESTKEYDCSTYASKATQTQMATMRLKNLHISAATQTDKPLPLQLTPRSRPVLGPLSPNMVAALGDTPSQRRSNRVQPVKKFGTGRRYVNKFNRDPILAVKRV
ncbi:MAG: hypothetical protein LQ340_003347 [Diploschistes diacapsis]|nr:MAG: hypothetical protein LQ340_003347 [Diploschistes diacapsis]